MSTLFLYKQGTEHKILVNILDFVWVKHISAVSSHNHLHTFAAVSVNDFLCSDLGAYRFYIFQYFPTLFAIVAAATATTACTAIIA
jgi:hypothetical protein